MKFKILLFGIFFTFLKVGAQVGINYEPSKFSYTPKSPLVIVATEGQEEKALRFAIPNQPIEKGQVLASDENGNVSWSDISNYNTHSLDGSYVDGGLDKQLSFRQNLSSSYYTGAFIELPNGIWNVNFDFKVKIKKQVRLTEDKIVYTNYQTAQKLSSDQFYNSAFRVKNSATSYRFDPNNDDEFRGTSDCVIEGGVEKCYYYFTKREIKKKGTTAWVPIDRDEAFWVRLYLSDNANDVQTYSGDYSKDIYIPSLFLASGDVNGILNMASVRGQIYINNKLANPKKYYLKIAFESERSNSTVKYKIENFAAGPMLTDYDRFFALPVNK